MPSPQDLLAREFAKLTIKAKAAGIAQRGETDPLTLLDEGEVVTGTHQDEDVLIVTTSFGRKLGIGPDASFSVLCGPEFASTPAIEPDPETAPAEEPEAQPDAPAEESDGAA